MLSNWSRRRFVGAMASSAGVLSCGLSKSAVCAESAKVGPFPLGMQSYTLRKFPFDKAIETMQALGIQTVEFVDAHYPVKSSDEEIATMNRQLADHQLKLLSHGVADFKKDHTANKQLFEFAKRAGIRNLTANPTEDAFDSLDTLVAEYDIRIAIHNHGPGARYDKI